MASNVTVPANFAYTAGSVRCTRVVPARFTFSASTTLSSTKDTATTTGAEVPELDRLTQFDQLLNKDGTPSLRFMAIWQIMCEQIEGAFVAVNARVDEVAILARLSAVESLAEVANDNAVAAQTTADNAVTATQETFTNIDPVYGSAFASKLPSI